MPGRRGLQGGDSGLPCWLAADVQLPSTEEIEALFNDRRLNTIVFFLDETFEELSYDLTTTVLEAVEQLAGLIKLQVRAFPGRGLIARW